MARPRASAPAQPETPDYAKNGAIAVLAFGPASLSQEDFNAQVDDLLEALDPSGEVPIVMVVPLAGAINSAVQPLALEYAKAVELDVLAVTAGTQDRKAKGVANAAAHVVEVEGIENDLPTVLAQFTKAVCVYASDGGEDEEQGYVLKAVNGGGVECLDLCNASQVIDIQEVEDDALDADDADAPDEAEATPEWQVGGPWLVGTTDLMPALESRGKPDADAETPEREEFEKFPIRRKKAIAKAHGFAADVVAKLEAEHLIALLYDEPPTAAATSSEPDLIEEAPDVTPAPVKATRARPAREARGTDEAQALAESPDTDGDDPMVAAIAKLTVQEFVDAVVDGLIVRLGEVAAESGRDAVIRRLLPARKPGRPATK